MKKWWFPIPACVVSCLTRTKNLGWYLIFTLYHSCRSGSQILVIDCRGIKLLCFANINWTYEHHQKKHIEHGEAMPLCFDEIFLFQESKAKVQGMMLKCPWLTLLWSTIASKDFQMLVNCERSGKKNIGKISTYYRTRAIITRGLYTFYPRFEVHLCTVTFGLMYG